MTTNAHLHPHILCSIVTGEVARDQCPSARAHITGCPDCASDLARHRAIVRLLRDGGREGIPAPVRRRLETTVERLARSA